jgi:hypothetical protein
MVLLRMSDRDIELQNGLLCLPEAMLELHIENCIFNVRLIP